MQWDEVGIVSQGILLDSLEADTLYLHKHVGIVSTSSRNSLSPTFSLCFVCLLLMEEFWEIYSFFLKSPKRKSAGQTWWQMATDTWSQGGEILGPGGGCDKEDRDCPLSKGQQLLSPSPVLPHWNAGPRDTRVSGFSGEAEHPKFS